MYYFKHFCLLLVIVPALCATISGYAAGNHPPENQKTSAAELRAFWVDGFNDGYKTASQCDELIANIRRMHCNAVFVQMRKRGDAYYASHYEPWALDDTDQFDALSYLCKIAHEKGKPYIQVHAWVNACAVGGNKNPKSIGKLHPEWFSISDAKADFDTESTKIDPGVPDAADWTARVYVDIVRHYPIDGIHMDFIRYGGTGNTAGHWGYNPVSVARFQSHISKNQSTPVWNDPSWQQWRRDQVTALVRRIYLSAIALNPHIIMSAATICWGDGPTSDNAYYSKSAAYNEVYADWVSWLKDGYLDLNCPMTYVDYSKHPSFWAHWLAFVRDHQFDHRSAMGVAAYLNDVKNTLIEIQDTRIPSATGIRTAGAIIFSYAGTNKTNGVTVQYNQEFYNDLSTQPLFATDVPAPNMPWKAYPQYGYILGVSLNNALVPNDNATITVRDKSGKEYQAIADGNGFWGLSHMHPGTYTVSDEPSAHPRSIIVKPGIVTYIWPDLPKRSVSGVGKLIDGENVILPKALVTVGTDQLGTYFYIADGYGKPAVKVNYTPSPVLIKGDVIALSGIIAHSGQAPEINNAKVRFIGATLGITP